MTHLLRGEPDAVRGVHRFEHVLGKRADFVIDRFDPFSFRPQERVAVFPNLQSHCPSRVNAGRFFTPASFNASITLMIVPNVAFLSACNASIERRVAGKFLTAASS